MLSAAKHLSAHRDRPFAEFTLSGANVLRVTNYHRSWLVKFIIGDAGIHAPPAKWPVLVVTVHKHAHFFRYYQILDNL